MLFYKNTWIRDDKYKNTDKKMVDDCQQFYSHFNLDSNSIVVDLGANIGGFAQMCKQSNVKKYVGVEPDSKNLVLAKKNAEGIADAVFYEGVASVSHETTLTFYQNGSPQGACSGTVAPSSRATAPMANNNKTEWSVNNYNIDKLLDDHKPTHLKVDIEGAEIDWLKVHNGKFPEYIQEISFEVHRKSGVAYFHDECLDNILKEFEIVSMVPNTGFPNLKRYSVFPKLGINIQGTLFGIDIFLRKKS